jgi:hypothetical protein
MIKWGLSQESKVDPIFQSQSFYFTTFTEKRDKQYGLLNKYTQFIIFKTLGKLGTSLEVNISQFPSLKKNLQKYHSVGNGTSYP